MILDPKKKTTTLAGPRYVPEWFKQLDYSSEQHRGMAEAIRRSERQPKLRSMNSRAEFNRLVRK